MGSTPKSDDTKPKNGTADPKSPNNSTTTPSVEKKCSNVRTAISSIRGIGSEVSQNFLKSETVVVPKGNMSYTGMAETESKIVVTLDKTQEVTHFRNCKFNILLELISPPLVDPSPFKNSLCFSWILGLITEF
eukprot:sb/3474890/